MVFAEYDGQVYDISGTSLEEIYASASDLGYVDANGAQSLGIGITKLDVLDFARQE